MERATTKNLFEIYCDSQQFRMRTVSRLKKSSNDMTFQEAGEKMIKSYLDVEKTIAARLKTEMQSHIMSQWLYANYGIGPILAAGLVSYIGEIEKFTTVSKMWKYSGMGTVDICQDCGKRVVADGARGAWIMHMADRLEEQNKKKKDEKKKATRAELITKATAMVCLCEHPMIKTIGQRRITGQMIDYKPKFKNLCYLIGDQFIKQLKSPYRRLYDEYKLEYSTRPDLKAEVDARKRAPKDGSDKHEVKGTAHINAMARRRAVKMFMSHFWETWRIVKSLPTPEPYAMSILGHTDKLEPFVSLKKAGYVEIEGKWMHPKILSSIPDHIDLKTVKALSKSQIEVPEIIDEDFTGSLGVD
jgi:hypothetical protein